MQTLEIGTRIRVGKSHWARSRHTGEIVEIRPNGRFVVKFDRQGVGWDEGWKLEMGQEDFDNG